MTAETNASLTLGKMLSSGIADRAIVSRGYNNWKDASGEKEVFNNSTIYEVSCDQTIVFFYIRLAGKTISLE